MLESVLRRDQYVVASALTVLAASAWAYILWQGANMPMDNGQMSMEDMAGMLDPLFRPWTLSDAGFMLAMWIVMMVGMMTPAAAPMILLYARVGRQARLQAHPYAATGWFAAGYLICWALFSILATGAQWGLEYAALLTPMLRSASRAFDGCLLLAAGAYQWTPFKYACLAQCQAPLSFIQRHGGFRPEAAASFKLGIVHGAYCVGCCWALMALLFFGGVMNPLWIAGLGALALLEKAVPTGRLVPRMVGAVLIAAGFWLLAGTAWPH